MEIQKAAAHLREGAPVAVSIEPCLNLAAVANQQDNTVSIIDLITQSVVSTIPVGNAPSGVAIAVNGTNLVAVSNRGKWSYAIRWL